VIDNQQISMIVPKNSNNFQDYMTLRDAGSDKKMKLSNNGVVISEKLAKLGHYKKGDTLTIKDDTNAKHKVKIDGIAQMYA
ncbi:hypothetical protein, partial [Photobacterium sanguinicancri]